MPKVGLYRRIKEGTRYRNVPVRIIRGRRPESLVGPFYIRFEKSWVMVGHDLDAAIEAQEQKQHFLEAKKHGVAVVEVPKVDRILIADACEAFMETNRNRAVKTRAAYRHHLVEFQRSTAKKFLDELTKADLLAYLAYMERLGHAKRTQHNRTVTILSMLKLHGIRGLISFKNDVPTYEEQPVRRYPNSELKKLWAACSPEELMRYKFFLGTAARDREVKFAAWRDIDFEARTFTVQAKSDVGFHAKSHETRDVPIPGWLVKMLKERKRVHPRWIFVNEQNRPEGHFLRKLKSITLRAGLNCGECVTEWMRLRKRYERVFDPAETERLMRKVGRNRFVTCKEYPVCEHWILHRFRKTCATLWMKSGHSIRDIQLFLGHKKLETTALYLASAELDDAEVHSLTDAAFESVH